ncbi:MAG: hypothetical protein NUV52_03655 [Candidatus Roizmanbacteria bacterium]|nr:hypothetical protein [Candidatus Roizmanbacteria bacterium]
MGTLTMIASNPTGMILADVSVQTAGGWKVANGGTRGTCALIITDGSVTMKAVAGTPSVHMVNEAWGITAHANAGGTNGEGCAFVKVFVFRSGNLAEYRLVDAASGSMQEVDPSMW